MIEVEGLTKRYGSTTVLSDVSFGVGDGEAVALWGPNGAGKTTVLRSIMGLVRWSGRIEVAGLDARRRGKAVRRRLGYVSQELAFDEDLTVAETMAFSARLRRLPARQIGSVLDTVGLRDQGGQRVGALSGGMKQRLALGLALLPEPPVLLLDEPTASLDAAARESMIRLLHDLQGPGRSLLLTSHHLEDVGALVQRVLVLDGGRVTTECAPSALADTLGLRVWLHVTTMGGSTGEALEALRARGFRARPNSHGLLVDVEAQAKGGVLQALHDAGVGVEDFEVWR